MNAFTTKESTAYYARLPAARSGPRASTSSATCSRAPALRDADVETERAGHPRGAGGRRRRARRPGARAHLRVAVPRPSARAGDGRQPRDGGGDHARRRARVLRALVPARHDGRGRGRARTATTRSSPRSSAASLGRDAGRRAPSATPPATWCGRWPCCGAAPSRPTWCVGFRGPDRDDPDREALDVLNHILGGGMSSRLFEEIREQRGLAYSVFSAPSTLLRRRHAVGVRRHQPVARGRGARPGRRRARPAWSADGLTGRRAGHRRRLPRRARSCSAWRTPGPRMSRLGGHVTARGYVRPVDEQIERYRAVTLDDITPCRRPGPVGPAHAHRRRPGHQEVAAVPLTPPGRRASPVRSATSAVRIVASGDEGGVIASKAAYGTA